MALARPWCPKCAGRFVWAARAKQGFGERVGPAMGRSRHRLALSRGTSSRGL